MALSSPEDIAAVTAEHDPDFAFYVEPRLTSRQRSGNPLQHALSPNYRLIYSLVPSPPRPAGGRRPRGTGKAGVVIAIAKRHAASDCLLPFSPPTQLRGYLAHARLQPPAGRALELIGAYCPCDDSALTAAIYDYVHTAIRRCKEADSPATLLVAGDFNATLHNTDRSSGAVSQKDTDFRAFVERCDLAPLTGWTTNREPTYRQQTQGHATSSRIDDVLVCLPSK